MDNPETQATLGVKIQIKTNEQKSTTLKTNKSNPTKRNKKTG